MQLSLPLSLTLTEIALIAIIVLLLLVILIVCLFQNRHKGFDEAFFRAQAELSGRLAQMSEHSSMEQGRIAQAINEQKLSLLKIIDDKLLQVTQKVGDGLQKSATKTDETLAALRERLAKIDVAQQKISSLSEQVVSLQEVLSNKQARGAFGEIQLNDLVTSILPPSAYSFQVVMGNQKRADCVLNLPNPPGCIVIDSKFPLESYQALRNANTDREKVEAERFFRSSVLKHIKDIADKYIIPGETAESALMFLPAESIYAELYTNFVDVVEVSFRSKVWVVSPTTLMATLNTVRAVLKDARMREQAGVIQKEVGLLIEDIGRLDERVENLAKHFDMATRDIGDIRVSSAKISRRVDKIEEIELGPDANNTLIPQKTEN